jgi:Flp pilus assembly protein TadG
MMMSRQFSVDESERRRASVLPILAISLVALVSFVALAVDVGMLVISRAQVQNAADLAALTAARSLDGSATNNYNQTDATTNAQNILSYNKILGQAIQNTQLQLSYGSYDYNQTSQTFNANFPATSGMPLTAVTSIVTSNNSATAFSSIFGFEFLPNVTATATAVHRPRDLVLALDLSGSMRFGTLLGFDFASNPRTTNNPDPLYPTFGPYSSSSANLQGPSSNRTSSVANYTISPTNTTVPNSSYSLTYINNFYQNAAYAATLIRAFDSYTSSDGGTTWSPSPSGTPLLPPPSYASTPGGDVPLFKQGSASTYATNVSDVIGTTTTNALWELDGYSAYSAGQLDTSSSGVPTVWTQVDYSNPVCQFHGYTQGPGYYGMTFFIWPPDPRSGAITSSTTLLNYLNLIGFTDATDQKTLTTNWNSWSLSQLQNWLKGGSTHGGPYTASGPFVPGSNNKAPLYYAVCRLYNRAYPAGSSNGAFAGDWRVRFFNTNDNTVLFNRGSNWPEPAGSLNLPGSYTINYTAILTWIAQSVNSSGQLVNPFPQQLRAGRIKYYGSIPTQLTGSWPSYGGPDQQFWKEVIDYSLGFRQVGANQYQDVSSIVGYGVDLTWGRTQISPPPAAPQSMNYTDNPARPLLRYWFGPLNMVDYLHNMNLSEQVIQTNFFLMQPGDSYEAPSYSGKQAFLGAISTMKTNNPNDWFSIAGYSAPRSGANGFAFNPFMGRFNCVRSPLGPNYNYAQAALLFPFTTINSNGSPNLKEITPYDPDPATGSVPSADLMDTPRGDGDTCFDMALMLAYNQFATTLPSDSTLRNFVSSSPITFPTGMAGGMGRKGAQKVVIFETDGIPNCTANASLVTGSGYNYYKIRYDMNNPNGSEYPNITPYGDLNDPAVLANIQNLVTQLKNDYGTTRNPFRLYAIGFGPVFQGQDAAMATSTLQSMQTWAQTSGTPTIVTGTDAQMTANMIQAYSSILQNGVQIALIK